MDIEIPISGPSGGKVVIARDRLLICGLEVPYRDVMTVALGDTGGFFMGVSQVRLHVDLQMRDGRTHGFTCASVRVGVPSDTEAARLGEVAEVVLAHLARPVMVNVFKHVSDGYAARFGPGLDVRTDGLRTPGGFLRRGGFLPWDQLAGAMMVGGRWEIRGARGVFASCGTDEPNGWLLPQILEWLHARGGRVGDDDWRALEAGVVP